LINIGNSISGVSDLDWINSTYWLEDMLLLDFGSCRARTGQKTLLENIMKCSPTARYSNVLQHDELIS
jgi:hypothetical protein